ncbi:probable serine/threonine-protein kinase cdc7 isoform X2 [Drosophila hydei]|uniref:Probable serine/threonine-protein kinase cdc7 isoform X2 n=1 Tax=Drosophila hydei TaxID=7224 RepID=A0A6J1MBW9_DROHY|nr:probable serine/threonine-protein kinase cdc7 isoform X2 [Drosophila hydei]
MDMDNASLAMELLRVAAEQNEATISRESQHTPSANPNSNADADSDSISNKMPLPPPPPPPTEYVSKFRIDGQPILPPLMTAEKRLQMRQLRQRAMELEAKYNQAQAARSTTTLNEERLAAAVDSSTNNNKSSRSNSSSNSSSDLNDSAMENPQRLSHLQQTETFIYDSTRQPQPQPQPLPQQPQQQIVVRPQTLDIEPKTSSVANVIPTICVNPPTPLCEQQTAKHSGTATPESKGSNRSLSTHHRKLNNITTRILQFENTGLGKKPQPAKLLWHNETVAVADKRMLRSSTSPSLSAAQLDMCQLHRSRSFTLDEPSQALVDHMERERKKPPVPLPPATTASAPAVGTSVSPRCRFALPGNVSSAHSLAHLRRDTVESKAKQVQRSVSSSIVDTLKSSSAAAAAAGGGGGGGGGVGNRRRGDISVRHQQQQKQLEELLQRALHEANDAVADQQHLTLAKQQMFKDIKSAHRDRFQQLVQYQHEEQRRMQEEFDRQQKFLIEQICTEINVSAYAHESFSGGRSPIGVSEYTSTDDLPTPSRSSPSNTITPISMDLTQLDELLEQDNPEESASNTARKRLFDLDNESEVPMELLQSAASSPRALPLRSRNSNDNSTNSNSSTSNSNNSNNNSSNSSKIKKGIQRNHSKPPGSKNAISPVPSAKSPPTRRVVNKTPTLTNNGNSRNQQQLTIAKSRRSGSPSRSTLSALDLETERRHIAATVLNAATRGFLVRRLFRTEQVQRIVQTIRDTLIFVLNLHLETCGNSLDQEEPANIRLKARLLQQLCSASRTLHLIFFQTSIKERMEIISRDRKRIKTKLLAMHVKHRN